MQEPETDEEFASLGNPFAFNLHNIPLADRRRGGHRGHCGPESHGNDSLSRRPQTENSSSVSGNRRRERRNAEGRACFSAAPRPRTPQVRRSRVGRGVFARRHYAAGEVIGEIEGTVMEATDYASSYCYSMGDHRTLEPEAPFRFLNHSCLPNSRFEWYDVEPPEGGAVERRRVRDRFRRHPPWRRVHNRLPLAPGDGHPLPLRRRELPRLGDRSRRPGRISRGSGGSGQIAVDPLCAIKLVNLPPLGREPKR